MQTRPYYVLLAAVFAVALGLRIGAAVAFQGLGAPPSLSAQPDQLDYEQLAYNVSIGAGYSITPGTPTARRPPGTSLALLPLYTLAGRSFSMGRVWFCLLSALACLATAWLATQAFGRPTGLVAAAGMAVYPGHFYYPMHFVSEVPFTLWLALGCAFAFRAVTSSRRHAAANVLAGACWALATLTRPQTIFLVPVGALFLLLSGRRHGLRYVPHVGIQLVVALLLLAPWVARNHVAVGKSTLSTVGGVTFWGAHNDTVLNDPELRGSWVRQADLVDASHPPLAGSEIEREATAWTYGLAFVRQHWTQMPMLVAMKCFRLVTPFEATPNRPIFWAFAASWLALSPWVVVGIWLAVKSNREAAAVLLAPVLATCAMTVVFYGSIRFRDSMIPVLMVLAAHGVVQAFAWLRARTTILATPLSGGLAGETPAPSF